VSEPCLSSLASERNPRWSFQFLSFQCLTRPSVHCSSYLSISCKSRNQVFYGQRAFFAYDSDTGLLRSWKTWKSHEMFLMVTSRPGKVMEKTNHKSFGKVLEMCYHIIYAEFEIINVFIKERRSKYEPAYALNTQNVVHFSCLFWDFSLVMDIWFKVLEIHRSTCVRTLT